MASYQAGLAASEASAATAAEPYRPSPSSSAKASNPSSTLSFAASASRDKGSHDYQHSYPSPSSALQSSKLPPGLAECPEKEIDTFIGCPIVVLLQHKDFCAVKLQAIEEGTHAIKCRNCPFQTSEPMVMLNHLAKLHKRFTDTQYLCQLNNTFMGQKPVCFGVTGYDELPDGLSDFLDGVYRWDKRTQSSVIVFPCRLCPTCYLTKSDLKTHYLSHQQALLSVNKSDGHQAMYVCRICRQEFQDFISYYDHHMWMRLSDEVLPPKKPEFAQKALNSPSQVSTGDGNKEAYPRQVAKQPRLLEPNASMSAVGGMSYNPQSQYNRASTSSTNEQTNALNLSVGQHQMSIVDRALTYPVYQTVADKQLEQGIVHLCCPFCQAVYKYRHWLAMHLQNIHGVNDKRALSEALSTSYAKSAANYYVAKTSAPVVPAKVESVSSVGQESKKDEVVVISSEKKEDLPMPRPDNKMLEALKLMPKMTPSLEQPPVQYAHSRKRQFDIPGRKTLMPQDEDEGIGEMESDEHLKPLVLNMPLSLQATNLNTPFMYQRSVVYSSGKGRKDKYPKSPARGRPPKKGPESPGKLAALCEELAKRVESRQGKESPDDKEGTSEGSVTCDICNKTFKHKNQLWGHKKTHSKIYTCRSGKDGRGTKTKSTRLGRRQNMPNFRDIANGKVPPLSEKMSVAIPEKKKPRNTLGSTKGTKQKHHLREPSAASAGVAVKEGNEADKKDKRLKKKKKKMAKRKRKALAKIITAYKENPQRKKKIFLKEGNNAFYPRRFFYRYCLLQRQERNRRMLAHLRQAVLLEIDADTKKNVYECLKCHRYHRFQSRCLQHYQDQHLSRKKQSQKLDATVPSKKGKEVPDTTKKVTSRVIDTKEDKKKGCHYCNTPGYKCSVHEAKTEATQRFEVKTDENGRNFFSCLVCHKIFAFQSAVLRHLNTHQVNQTRDVPCPSCSFIAKSPLSLAAHSRVHKKSPNKDSSDLNRTAMQQQRPQVDSSKPKKVYNCDQCKSAFYNFNALRLHKTTHKDYFPYRCSQCPACFKKAEDMYDHIQQMHPTKNQFKCSKCTYSSSSYTTLLKHERGHDREENKMKALRSPLWKKDVAMPPPDTAPGSSGMNAGALDLRMTSSTDRPSPEKDKNSETNVKISDKQSEIDDKVGPGKGTVNIEMVKGDEKKIENGEKKKEKVKVPTEAEIIESLSVKFNKVEVASGSDEGWFFCTECSFTTNVQDSYLRHFKMHERAEMLTCDECQFPVLDQQGLEEHMLKAHNKNVSKLSCDMCQYVTSVPERMVRHKRLHKKMTLQCDHCGYRTPEKRFMIRHILTVHEQQRPFNCEKCNYATAYKHHLKRHYRLHKQQILQCPKCVHCTLDEKLMLHHIQSHKTNTTNVKCDVCNREFVNSKSLAIHKSRDHGKQSLSVEDAINHMTPGRQYRCEISSVKTHQETPLQLHTVSAQEGVPEVYKCKQCPYKTTHQSSITLHMMQEHIEESDIQMKIKDLRDVKQCAQCGFCTTKDQLDAHMRSHLEKDVYTCDDCNFKTSHFYALSRHTCIQEAGGSSEVMDKQEKIKRRNKESGPDKQDEIQEVDNQEGKHGDSEMTKLDEVQELDQQGTSQGSQSTEEDDLKKSKEDEVQETDKQGMAQEIIEDENIQGEQQEQAMDLNEGTPPVDQMPQIKTEPGSIPTEVTKAPEVIQPSTKVKQSQENNNETSEPVLQQQPGAVCQLCQKTYETENHLKNHVKIDHTHLVVNAQNPFVCVLCPYSSCSEKEARRHLGLHNYEQEFKCEFCVFSTATASSIATHRKVHRNNKRHSTLTSKRKNACLRVPATLIGNYASGILIDVGGVQKRRYPCKFCGDVFQVAEEWQHHERRHLMVWNMEHAAEASK